MTLPSWHVMYGGRVLPLALWSHVCSGPGGYLPAASQARGRESVLLPERAQPKTERGRRVTHMHGASPSPEVAPEVQPPNKGLIPPLLPSLPQGQCGEHPHRVSEPQILIYPWSTAPSLASSSSLQSLETRSTQPPSALSSQSGALTVLGCLASSWGVPGSQCVCVCAELRVFVCLLLCWLGLRAPGVCVSGTLHAWLCAPLHMAFIVRLCSLCESGSGSLPSVRVRVPVCV